MKEARARIKINKALEASGWQFFDSPEAAANIVLEPNVKLTEAAVKAATGVAQKTVSLRSLRAFKIPLPPLEIQRTITAELEAERMLVDANRELIDRMVKKIEAAIARVWSAADVTILEIDNIAAEQVAVTEKPELVA